MVPHTRPLLVSGSGTGGELAEEQRQVGVQSSDYEGPTTITYLIPQEAARKGIETRTYVVHLPQYFQVDEDMMGTARLTEILCSFYNLPARLIQQDRGREQYDSVADMVKDEGEDITSLLQQLEEHYDRERREKEPPPPPLSANIEEFLRDLNQEFDRPGES